MKTFRIGRIVTGSLVLGPASALALVAGPFAGAREHVITGAVLVAFALSWALLAILSGRSSAHPQRWAMLPAAFMGLAGVGLLSLAPGDAVLDGLGWIWPPLFLVVLVRTAVLVRRHLVSQTRLWIVYPLLTLYSVTAVGGAYETAQQFRERRLSNPPGQLVDVGGRRLHLLCAGFGSPTVILESGLGASSDSWAWIATRVSKDTRVCAYDRAGRAWSDDAGNSLDGVGVARDLHALLDQANVPGPYVLVGHSSGAQYVRIFAGLYPERVAGMVLLDGQPAEALAKLPTFPRFYTIFRRVYAVLPTLARLGLGRLLRQPSPAARYYRSVRDEFVALPAALGQAGSFHSIGERPLVVVTAAVDNQIGWLPLQKEMAALSTNSSQRIVPYTHDALLRDERASTRSSDAIRDVVAAVRSGTLLHHSF